MPVIGDLSKFSDQTEAELTVIFAAAGIVESDAATVIRVLERVVFIPYSIAENWIRQLGLRFVDDDDAFVGVFRFALELDRVFSGATDVLRDTVLLQIFGTDAARAANVLIQHSVRQREALPDVSGWSEIVDQYPAVGPVAMVRTQPHTARVHGVDWPVLAEATGGVYPVAEVERLRQHSVTLNALAYEIAGALGKVSDGEDYFGDAAELVRELIADRDSARTDSGRLLVEAEKFADPLREACAATKAAEDLTDDLSRKLDKARAKAERKNARLTIVEKAYASAGAALRDFQAANRQKAPVVEAARAVAELEWMSQGAHSASRMAALREAIRDLDLATTPIVLHVDNTRKVGSISALSSNGEFAVNFTDGSSDVYERIPGRHYEPKITE